MPDTAYLFIQARADDVNHAEVTFWRLLIQAKDRRAITINQARLLVGIADPRSYPSGSCSRTTLFTLMEKWRPLVVVPEPPDD